MSSLFIDPLLWERRYPQRHVVCIFSNPQNKLASSVLALQMRKRRLRETEYSWALNKDQKQWSWGSNVPCCLSHEPLKLAYEGGRESLDLEINKPGVGSLATLASCGEFKLLIPPCYKKASAWLWWEVWGGVAGDGEEGLKYKCSALLASHRGRKETSERDPHCLGSYKTGRVTWNATENCDSSSSCVDGVLVSREASGREAKILLHQNNSNYYVGKVYCIPGTL